MRTVVQEERDFDGKTVPFFVKEVPRARKISIRVTHEGVVVTKPRRVPKYEVEAFVKASTSWIVGQLADREQRVDSTLIDQVPYLGVERVIKQATVPPVRLAGEEFWAMGESPQERAENVVHWMRRRARPVLRDSVFRWSAEMGLTVERVSVRDQTSRWGSCSSTGSLSLNWRLIMAPPEVLEYIVIHELAHIEEHNHSRRFWSLVKQYCPDYRNHEKWLDEHGERLISVGR